MNDTQNAQFSTRPAQPTDADELTTLLNDIKSHLLKKSFQPNSYLQQTM